MKFTKDTLKYVKNEKNKYHMGKVFYWDVIRDNEIAWKAPEITKDDSGLKTVNYTGTIATVRKMLKKNTPLLTRMPLEDKGSIANETLYSKDKAKEKIYIPFKFSDPKIADVKKYGGFTAVNRSYFFLVEHELKGKRVRTLETVPVYMREKIEHNPEELEKYCTDELGLKNPSIRMRKIKMQSFVRFNDYYGLITGITGNNILVRNNVSLYLSKEETGYIAHLERIAEKGIKIADDKENDKDTEENGKKSEKFTVTREKNINIYNILLKKHVDGIYSKRSNSIGDKLTDGYETFKTLDLNSQVKVILEILKISSIGKPMANLLLVGGKEYSGALLFNKNISNFTTFQLINQSVTGVYEKRIDLLTV